MFLSWTSLPPDAIVDEDAPPYPAGAHYDLQELTTDGYAALLRIERGRVRHREIFAHRQTGKAPLRFAPPYLVIRGEIFS